MPVIQKMNISNKDFNLLYLFHVLYQERNATLAAQRMALSQPALSHKLNKLRHQFGDPLFVRAPRGLTPTPRAHELAPEVERLVVGLEGFYERCEGQDFLARPARLHRAGCALARRQRRIFRPARPAPPCPHSRKPRSIRNPPQ